MSLVLLAQARIAVASRSGIVLFLVLALGALPSTVSGQPPGVVAAAPLPLDVDAGRPVTIAFRATNTSGRPLDARSTVAAPGGWQVLFIPPTLVLGAHKSATQLVTVVPPRGAAAGAYGVALTLAAAEGLAPITVTATIRIAERHGLAMTWNAPPSVVVAGDTAELDLQVTNTGNVDLPWHLSLRASSGSVIATPEVGETLEGGESRQIRVEVRATRRVSQARREVVTAVLTAGPLDAPVRETVAFEVVPVGSVQQAARRELPSRVGLRFASGRTPGIGSFNASGALDAAGRVKVGVVYEARESSHPLMLEQDRMTASLSTPHLDVAIGDQLWATTRLTEAGRFGFGAGVQAHSGAWAGGLMVDAGRRDLREGSQAGAHAAVQLGDLANVRLQYLRRFEDDVRSRGVADLGSVLVSVTPTTGLKGDVEVATGRSAAGRGAAVSASASHTSAFATLYAQTVRANAAYPVRDRTALTDAFSVNLRPVGALNLSAAYNATDRMDDLLLPANAPSRRRLTRGSAAWGRAFQLNAMRSEWTTVERGWGNGWRRESIWLQVRLPIGPLTLTPLTEYGFDTNPNVPGDVPFTRHSLRAELRSTRFGTVYVRGDIRQSDGGAGSPSRNFQQLSFGGTVRPLRGTTVSLDVGGAGDDAPWLGGTQWMNATVTHVLPWKHTVRLRYRQLTSGTALLTSSSAYRLDYVVPLGLPLIQTSSGGTVVALVTDGATGAPLPRMLLRMSGRALLTDDNGRVKFTDLGLGSHYLSVDAASIGAGRTVQPGSPLRVDLHDETPADVELTVVRVATVRGTLRRYVAGGLPRIGAAGTSVGSPEMTAAEGLPLAQLRLVSSSGASRTVVTDSRGAFEFRDVVPGAWRLLVIDAPVPAFHRLDHPDDGLFLEPGEIRDVTLRVVPKAASLRR